MYKLKAIVEYKGFDDFGCKFLYKSATVNGTLPATPKEFIIMDKWVNKKAFWVFNLIPDGLGIKLSPTLTYPAREDKSKNPMMRVTLYDTPEIKVINKRLYLKYNELYVLVKTKSPIDVLPDGEIIDQRARFISKTKIEKVIAYFHIIKSNPQLKLPEQYILRTDFHQIIGINITIPPKLE